MTEKKFVVGDEFETDEYRAPTFWEWLYKAQVVRFVRKWRIDHVVASNPLTPAPVTSPYTMARYNNDLVCQNQCGGYLETPMGSRIFCSLHRGHETENHVHTSPGVRISWMVTK